MRTSVGREVIDKDTSPHGKFIVQIFDQLWTLLVELFETSTTNGKGSPYYDGIVTILRTWTD